MTTMLLKAMFGNRYVINSLIGFCSVLTAVIFHTDKRREN